MSNSGKNNFSSLISKLSFALNSIPVCRQNVNFQPLELSGDSAHSSDFKQHGKVNIGVFGIAGICIILFSP